MTPDRRLVVGLDFSLTCTGMAALDTGTGELFPHRVRSKGAASDTVETVARRIGALVRDISTPVLAMRPDIVVFEKLEFSVRGADTSSVRRGGLLWGVLSCLVYAGIPVAGVSPAQMHKFASGKATNTAGSKAKDRTLVAAARTWPELDITTNDIADAAWLAAMGAYRLGSPTVPVTAYRDAAVGRDADWPESVAV